MSYVTATELPTLCAACPAGTFAEASGASSCKACAAGEYQNVTGSSSCEACPEHSNSTARSAVCACYAGFYGDGTSSCDACPEHSNSTAGSDACVCDAGFYRDGSSSCRPCPENASSLPGSVSVNDCTCNLGFSGDGTSSCEACVPGKYRVPTADLLADILSLYPAYLMASAESWNASQQMFMDLSGNGRVGTLRALPLALPLPIPAVSVGSVTGNLSLIHI